MGEKGPEQFRMRMDDGSADTFIQEEILDSRIEKLSHRITLVAILIPVLLVVILILAYLDLTKRVISFHDTGSTEVQALEKNLAERFSSLSVKQAKIVEAQEKLAESLKTETEKYGRNLKALEARFQKAVDRLGQTKIDRKELKSALTKIDKSLNPIRKDLKAVSSRFKTLEKNLSKELTHLNGSLADFNELLADLNKRTDQTADRVAKLQADISELTSKKINQNDLHLALDKEKKIYRQMLSLITKRLEERLDAMDKKIQQVEKENKIARQIKAAESRPEPPPVKSEPKPEPPPVKPKPGKIIEQNLR